MTETQLVSKIKKKVQERYPLAYVRKLADRFNRGIPDLVITFCDTLYVEVKLPDGVVDKIQAVEHEKILCAGGKVIVARSVEDVLQAMEYIPKELRS